MPGRVMESSREQQERKRKELLSNHSDEVIEKAMPSQEGALMQQPQDVGEGSQHLAAMHSCSTGVSPGNLVNHHSVKEEAEEPTAQLWETQWQEFLSTVDVSPSVPGVPQEPAPWDDTPAFLASFEQVARAYQWPEEEWAARLLPTLKGEAELAFSSLEDEEREDYGKVKAAILRGDALNREKNRQCFRRFCYEEAKGPRETYNQLQELCHQWLKAERNSKEQILELLILEQFLTVLPPEIQSWVKKHNLESSAQAVSLAEDFVLKWTLVKEEQIAESQGEGSMNLSELTGTPSDAEQRPQFCRESEMEEDTDCSDVDVSDSGEVCENDENLPQENPGHYQIHTGEKQYMCSDCGEGFSSRISLETHQRTHVGQKLSLLPPEMTVYICSECGETFNSTLDLDAHQRIHTEQKSYTCKECGEKFFQMVDLRKHQRIHIGERPFKFSRSEERILLISSRKRNRKFHSGNNTTPVLCKRTQMGKKMYLCSKCGKLCPDSWKLKRHVRVHTREKPFKHTNSRESFRQNLSLERHTNSHEGKEPQPLLKRLYGIQKEKRTCADCKKSFRTPLLLIKHQCTHIPKKSYKCMDCEESFLSSSSLDEHRKVHNVNKLVPLLPNPCSIQRNSYKCSECGKSFVSQRSHTREKSNKCIDCLEKFTQQTPLEKHRKIHKRRKLVPVLEKIPAIQRKLYTCKACGESFECQLNLIVHQCVRAGKKSYKCADCGDSFTWPSSLDRHRKMRHKEQKLESLLKMIPGVRGKPYKCKECGKCLSTTSGLLLHQRLHTGEKPYKCTVCGESFSWASSLAWHRKNHNGKKSAALLYKLRSMQRKYHKCSVCGKSFYHQTHLRKHRCIATQQKPYACAECGESFMSSASLEMHRKIHKRKKTVSPLKGRNLGNTCSECGKKFTTTSELARHQCIHTEKKPYQCTDCGKCFTGKASLWGHRKAHRGQKSNPFMQKLSGMKGKSYGCLKCEKSFRHLFELKRHQRIHTQEKSYKCMDCGERFLGLVSLDLHRMTIHKGKKLVPLLKRINDTKGKCLIGSKYGKKLNKQSKVLRQPPAETETKSNICAQCGKSFSWRSSLLRHKNIHLGLKPFKCCECGRCFFLKEYLVRHMKCHSKSR
ncbi:zinc finger and SCAN domain-containing protein 2-like isoform X2 [Sceloporus undulatus]|uniref:zinc finger and SCAN domain-containing protein 2-like isoform X2 n=1 Tax=Sceloporus undulatus TaxID=8520 RepID=UPI001C4B3736|nr:zinc finger and SCAN domain-containing protein 2-like isoform X2 [Sceloporus undulatus]